MLAILFRLFGFLAPRLLNYLAFNYFDFGEGYSRNASCELNFISALLFKVSNSTGSSSVEDCIYFIVLLTQSSFPFPVNVTYCMICALTFPNFCVELFFAITENNKDIERRPDEQKVTTAINIYPQKRSNVLFSTCFTFDDIIVCLNLQPYIFYFHILDMLGL